MDNSALLAAAVFYLLGVMSFLFGITKYKPERVHPSRHIEGSIKQLVVAGMFYFIHAIL